MTNTQLYIFLGVTHLFYIWSFVLSYKAINKKNIQPYMKGFYIYPLVGLILIIFFWLAVLQIIPEYFYSQLNKFSLIFHYCFLAFFICRVLKKQGNYNIEKQLFWIFLVIIICFTINDFVKNTHTSFSITNICLLIFCLDYYNKLFINVPIIHLTKEPSFWIINGVFLGMGITIPLYFFNDFLFYSASKNLYYLLLIIGALGYSFMHLFFIKAFLCKTIRLK